MQWLIYVVTSKYSQNQFISEKYKAVKSSKLHFLQNSPHVQIYTSVSIYKGVGKIPGSHFVETFSALPSYS
jgi:hypothetical protein